MSLTRSHPLASQLDDALRVAKTVWPRLEVDGTLFLEYLTQRLPSEDAEALAKIEVSDLYLAFACAQGSNAAHAEFERSILSRAVRNVRRVVHSPLVADEVVQKVRGKLFLGEGGGSIREYSGKGKLTHWTRVVALRTALDVRRTLKDEVALDDDLLETERQLTSSDPELRFIKERYRPQFRLAFRAALEELEPRDRTTLKMHYVDGLTLDEIGRFYRVNKSTVSRRLNQARNLLLHQTRASLRDTFDVDEAELDSLMNLLISQLDVSLNGLLKNPSSETRVP